MSIERPTTAVSSTRLKATNRRAWPDSRWRFIGDGLHSSSASDRKTSRIAGDTRQSASLSTFSTLGMSHSDTLQLTQELQSNGHLDGLFGRAIGSATPRSTLDFLPIGWNTWPPLEPLVEARANCKLVRCRQVAG